MTAAVLWRRLAALGITVSADDGDLELEGDLEALDEALIAEIRAAKPALLDWIAAREIRPRPEAAADYPLSGQQQRLWFVQTLDPDSAAYNLPAAFRLSGALDVARLEAVLHRIMVRHAALRTRFVAVDGLPRQVVLPPEAARITLDVTDLTGVPAQARLEEARRLAAVEAARPFDLSVAPLIRAALFRLGARDHLLVITLHHIVADGWSIALLMREVALLWHGESLPALRLDYADYALWQNGPGAPVQDEALDWWKAALADLPPVSTFPADFARPALPLGQGGAVDLELAAPVVAGLRRLAAQQGTTLFTLLLAGQGALLARYARQEDICIGSPVANRARAEVEGIFGFFVNMVALRCQPRPDLPLGDYLRAVREQVEAAFAHQSAPFERVVEATGAARRLDQAPLFQTVLVLQNAAGQAVHLPGLEVTPFALPAAPPKFDLTVTAVELPEGGLSLQLAYDAGLFRPDTAARIGRNLTALLQAMAAADLSVPLGDLPILGIEEQALLTVTLARGARSEGMADPVARLAALAAGAPDHPAIVCGAAGLSRQGLDLLARRFATALRARGIGPGHLVAIHAEAEPWRVAAMLAVLRCGAAYLPLEPSYPAERLAYMLEDAAPALVIGGRVAFAGGRPCLDPADVAGLPPDDNAPLAAPAEAAAYVIYTSGSTGRPKGVVVPHRGLRNLCNWMADYLSFGPDSRFVATMRFGFDGSVAETWPILAAGGTLVMTPQPVQDDPAHLLDWLADQQADACFLTTPLAELGMAGGQLDRAGMAVMTGGDRLRQRPAEGAGWVLHNNYGPTETTVIATAGAVAPGAGDDPAIGQPIGNTRIYLLDARLNPVPLGAVGELWIAGEGVAQGYLNQPGQTAAAFLPDPFGPPGARMYRSGDLARRRADGALHHLGRADAQISLRGYRIEPGEIEQALTRQPGVEQALVLAREGRLLAWVIAAEGAADPAALRRALARDLPEHMVPAAILPLGNWPMTANGKIDRAALPQPEVQAGSFTPPQGETELWLAGIWQDLLGVAQVGREDNFFALGGHSLLTTQAASRIRAERGADLPLRLFFEAPTLADLAAALDERAATGARGLPVLHPRAAGREDLPLSFAQQRLWFLDQLEPGNPFYNIPGALRLQGRLEHGLLQQTLDRLIARHETLRTHFPTVQGVPRQVVRPRLDLPLRVTDLSAHDAATRDRLARDLVAADARAPFDLTTGPLLRAHLVVLAPEDHLLLVNLHHIIADGWSMGVLMREVAAIYAALQAGEGADPLPPMPVQYGDFALWQRDWLSGEELARQEGYWLARLADLPATPLPLPLDHPRPAAQSHRGATHSFDIGAGLAARLKALASGQGATLFMVLNAVYAVLLARYSGQTDIPVGSPIANRRSAQVEGMIGFFVNTIVLRHAVEPGQSFAGFLSQVRRTALEAFDHQDLPFEQLIDLLNPERSLAHAPVFQVSFALQNAPAAAADLPGLRLLSVEAEAVTAKFDLTLTGFETGTGLHFDCEYATDLFDATTIERFCHDYAALLGAVVDAPDTALHALPLVTAEDRARLAGWNDTAAPMPAESALAAFEAQAQARPDAVALSWNDEDLTYAALDRRANRLAHALIAAGLRPGAAVGLGCGRGPDHVVAMLAANKAGAVYVMLPLDAPDDRIGFILRDTGMRHVIGRPEPRWGDAIVIAPEAEGQPGTPPAVARPDRAYVVYTSGTTGAPKGSINTHSGLANMSRWYAGLCDLRPGTAVSVVANIAFDGILPEIWPALMVGARLVLVPDEVLRDAWALADHLARARVEVLYLPMGYLETLAATGFNWPQSLTRVVAGGDRMKRYVLPPERGLPLINIYGPSETQSISTAETVLPGHDGPITIGRPIPNVRIHILDAMLNELPPGAVGEICIAGAGVGEGYLARPGLTAERFVPDPSGPPGARMYRSGDMGRFLPDGRIDYLGRGDGQLKIRGFRVETGEVEAALLAQPGIAEALVLAKPDPVAGARLLAWVVPEAESRESTHWESTFDQIYAEEAADETPADSGFDITGWTDSYSGAAIPAPEMAEWLEETIARIAGLSPRHVLEIGCGTGMILHRIAGQAETYTGTDLSQTVLTRLARSLPRDHAVRLLHAPADDWSQLGDQRFDTVILNSVAQYFPGLAYLADWLAGAVARVETGTIFLGDLRNFALAEAFQTSVALHHAGPAATVADLRQDVARRLAAEPELLVDPVWFHAFAASQPRICRVDVLPKEGAARNELMRFRYDVLLHIGPVAAQTPEDWQPAPLPEALPDLLAAAVPRLALRDLPFAPPAGPLASARLLHELPDAAPANAVRVPEPAGFDARSLRDLAAAHGYHLDLGLASGTGHVHAVFRREDAPPAHWPSLWPKPPRLSLRLANTPHIPERDTTLSRRLTEALGQSLPSYMLPSSIMVLSGFPLSLNGKVDRRALPLPVVQGGSVVVRAGVEAELAGLWA
ncbi:amino acid adenylation domain-containing protein, partial [Gemmobacter lutimaris]